MEATFDSRFACVSATGLGSFVVPDENWINATLSVATSTSARFMPPSPAAGTQPRRPQDPTVPSVGHTQARVPRPQHGRRLRVVFVESSQPDGRIQRNGDGSC